MCWWNKASVSSFSTTPQFPNCLYVSPLNFLLSLFFFFSSSMSTMVHKHDCVCVCHKHVRTCISVLIKDTWWLISGTALFTETVRLGVSHWQINPHTDTDTHKQTKTDVDRKKWCLDWEKSEQWRQWDTQSLTNHLSLFCVNWNTNHLEIMDICVQCAWIILFFYLTLLAMWASFHISRKTLFDYVIELPNDFVYDTFC